MDTHLSHLYGTNHVPTGTELLEIERLLAPHNAHLLQLEKDLKEAEAKVARLKKEQQDILEATRPLRALGSLIRRFPREIMELIFAHSEPAGRPIWSVCNAPLILLRVCRSWREIALTTPQLWRSVNLGVPPHLSAITGGILEQLRTQQRLGSFVAQVDRWLKHSASCPLSIIVRGLPFAVYLTSTIVSSLVDHSSRWESVDLDASLWASLLSSIHPDSLPTLRHLRLSSSSFGGPFEGPERTLTYQAILSAPHLKTLHIQVAHSYSEYLTMPIKWANLTRLSLEGFHGYPPYQPAPEQAAASELLPILNHCRNLRIFSLTLQPNNVGQPLPAEPTNRITVPNLEALNIMGCRSQIHLLFQSIDTPKIREVQYQPSSTGSISPLGSPPQAPTRPPDPLTSFLQRYGQQMEVLLVNTVPVSREDLEVWLECTPVLKQLTFGDPVRFGRGSSTSMPVYPHGTEECSLDDSFVKLLTPEPNQPFLCPNLRILRCGFKSRISGDAVLAFLMARTQLAEGHSRIEEVSMQELMYDFPFAGEAYAEDERLKQIREAGVRLSFHRTLSYYLSDIYDPAYGYDFSFFD